MKTEGEKKRWYIRIPWRMTTVVLAIWILNYFAVLNEEGVNFIDALLERLKNLLLDW